MAYSHNVEQFADKAEYLRFHAKWYHEDRTNVCNTLFLPRVRLMSDLANGTKTPCSHWMSTRDKFWVYPIEKYQTLELPANDRQCIDALFQLVFATYEIRETVLPSNDIDDVHQKKTIQASHYRTWLQVLLSVDLKYRVYNEILFYTLNTLAKYHDQCGGVVDWKKHGIAHIIAAAWRWNSQTSNLFGIFKQHYTDPFHLDDKLFSRLYRFHDIEHNSTYYLYHLNVEYTDYVLRRQQEFMNSFKTVFHYLFIQFSNSRVTEYRTLIPQIEYKFFSTSK